MGESIVAVVAADLAWSTKLCGNQVVVGPETDQACRCAVAVAEAGDQQAEILALAGYSSEFRVTMSDVMRAHMATVYGYPHLKMRSLGCLTATFDTYGEMKTLAGVIKQMRAPGTSEEMTIYLVCRWWHLPRAYFLLRAQFEPEAWYFLSIVKVFVPSRDCKGIIREPFAWLKNIPRMLQSVVC